MNVIPKPARAVIFCVDKCPSRIIRPQALSYGFKGILEPELDYTTGYCQYECNICSQVCPANAIIPVSLEEKKTIHLGTVNFMKEKCIVITNNMVDYINNLRIPLTNTEICVGCGACEHICPVRPDRAITVTPNPVHKIAKNPAETKQLQKIENKDFPF